LRIAFTIWFTLVVLIVVAILYGRTQPSDLEKIGFSACAGKPCFMGITLDMSWHEATALLAQHKEATIFGDVGALVDINNASNVVSLSSDYTDAKGVDRVEKIEFTAFLHPEIRPALGSFIALYGTPCQIYLIVTGRRIERIFVIYPSFYFVIFSGELLPTSKVEYMTLSNHLTIMPSCTNEANLKYSYSWKGFRDLYPYLE
jgi:hypothetical protein